jgi:LysR family transcriptional regulator, nitrogen assimilation regulatory protein
MNVKQLEYFLAVVRANGFSKAATILGLTQPALSRQVARLEEEVGVRLLSRNGRGAELTDAGQALVGHAGAILERIEQARADMSQRQQSPRGRVTVGLPPRVAGTITTDLVMAFRDRFPEASISIAEALSIPLREWLTSGRIDVAVLFDPPASPALNFELLVRESLVMVSNEVIPNPIRFSQALDYPMVLPSRPHALRQLIESAARPRKLTLKVVAEVDSIHAVIPLVQKGLASTLLPVSAIYDPAKVAQLNVSRVIAPSIRNALVLAQAKAKPDTPLTRVTRELLRDLIERHYGARPA